MKNTWTVTAVLMLGFAFLAYGQDTAVPYKPDLVQLQLEIRWGGEFSTNPGKNFSNIPAIYRTVPWHPDDDSTGKLTATITDGTLSPSTLATMSYVGSAGIMFKERFALRMGIGFTLLNTGNTLSPGNTGQIRSVNIYSGIFERGYGTSLVYDAVKYKGLATPRPYFIPEVEVRVGSVGILAGAWQKPYEYVIERGYDRYDALQKLDQMPFASVTATHVYLGLRFKYLGFEDKDDDFRTVFAGALLTVGPVRLRTHFAPNALGAKVNSGSGVMFGFTFIFGGPVKRFGINPATKK